MRARLISFIVAGFLIGALAGAAILLVTTPRGGQPVQSSGTAPVGGPLLPVRAPGHTAPPPGGGPAGTAVWHCAGRRAVLARRRRRQDRHRHRLPRELYARLLRLHPL